MSEAINRNKQTFKLCESENSNLLLVDVMQKAGEDIGIKDVNGNDIFVGCVIKFNKELFLIKWSKNRKQFVARKEPLKGQKMSWRDMEWMQKLSDKYIEIVGTILFDEEMRKRFKGVYI